MSPRGSSRSRTLLPLGELLLCALAFYAAVLVFPPADSDWRIALSISAAASWLAWPAFEAGTFGVSLWLDCLFRAAGLNLLAQYGLAYVFSFRPVPLGITIAGVILSAILVGAERSWVSPKSGPVHSPTILVGFDSVSAALAPFYGRDLLGVVEADPARAPAGIRYLGPPERLIEIAAQTRPVAVAVSGRAVAPRLLLELQYSGIRVDDAADLYEAFLGRLRWDRLPPATLLFSELTNADRFGMAAQSVYTNAIGLALLAIAAPLMIAVAISVALANGGGPVFETSERLGFQMVPFRLIRFSLRRRDGRPHALAKTLTALRLSGLPQILNVVRGEMAFFGPPAARTETARRIGALMPVYAHRFTVKPGILGWSQLRLRRPGVPADEAERLEYDLYYVKQSSLSLDLEILLKTLFGPRGARPAVREAAGASCR
jgi:lipopolysaccharide/colanic/teichoic acid biosynthesis glycosyltransferase